VEEFMDKVDIEALERWYQDLQKESRSAYIKQIIVGVLFIPTLLLGQITAALVMASIFIHLSHVRRHLQEKSLCLILTQKYLTRILTTHNRA
jgi:hypothetical protein